VSKLNSILSVTLTANPLAIKHGESVNLSGRGPPFSRINVWYVGRADNPDFKGPAITTTRSLPFTGYPINITRSLVGYSGVAESLGIGTLSLWAEASYFGNVVAKSTTITITVEPAFPGDF